MLGLILVSLQGRAQMRAQEPQPPYGFQGSYAFLGQVEALHRKTVDVIDLRMADAQQRLQTLRQMGAQCQQVNSQTLRCQHFLTAQQVPVSSLEVVRQRNRGLVLQFGQEWASPSLISAGESLIEWKMAQHIQWPRGRAETYRYLLLTPNLVKLVLTAGPQETLWLHTQTPKELRQMHQVTTSEGRWRFHEDLMEAVLVQTSLR